MESDPGSGGRSLCHSACGPLTLDSLAWLHPGRHASVIGQTTCQGERWGVERCPRSPNSRPESSRMTLTPHSISATVQERKKGKGLIPLFLRVKTVTFLFCKLLKTTLRSSGAVLGAAPHFPLLLRQEHPFSSCPLFLSSAPRLEQDPHPKATLRRRSPTTAVLSGWVWSTLKTND